MSDPLIPQEQYLPLLRSLNVGSPIAESDNLLEEARIDTPVFWDILNDKIDIVRGTKGSGKSALYRLVVNLDDMFLNKQKVVVLRGVEVTGDPVFAKFRDEFDKMSEIDFQNFWRIYFISIINNQFIESSDHAELLKPVARQVRSYKDLAAKNGFPIAQSLLTYEGLVKFVLAKMPRLRVTGEVGPDGSVKGTVEPIARQSNDLPAGDSAPMFVNELHESLQQVLEKVDRSVWIVLDRLDEVFPRRSVVERTALRALLKTTLSYTNYRLRLKLFLRDDVFDSITDVPDGFPALTHVVSRCSDTLTWSKGQIQHLVVRRVCTSPRISAFFSVNVDRLKRDEHYRRQVFGQVFPDRIRPGRNQSQTLDWIYKPCEDGQGVVTPRDVIDLLTFAKGHQLELVTSHETPMDHLLSGSSITFGHKRMALKKRDTFFKAEFPHLWKLIERFEHRKAEHTESSMEQILGPQWQEAVRDLRAIGFLRYNDRSKSFGIPFIYRECLHIRQGREV